MTSPLAEEPPVLAGGGDAASLARDMIEVHGVEAATLARHHARAAAIASQPQKAKSWLRVLDLIQRQHSGTFALPREPDRRCSTPQANPPKD